MTAIILAGGKAGRMAGADKAFLEIDNQPLISLQLRLLRKLFAKIIVVTNSPERYRSLKGVKVISDIVPHQGPLGGIYSGLKASRSLYNFVVACDMPFIGTGLIAYMQKKSSGYDAVVPKINNRFEPLYSIYSRNCLVPIARLLDKGIFKVNQLFPAIKAKEITEKEVRKFAIGISVFTNINTREDLADAHAQR